MESFFSGISKILLTSNYINSKAKVRQPATKAFNPPQMNGTKLSGKCDCGSGSSSDGGGPGSGDRPSGQGGGGDGKGWKKLIIEKEEQNIASLKKSGSLIQSEKSCPPGMSPWEFAAAIDPQLRSKSRDILEKGRAYRIVCRSPKVVDLRRKAKPQIPAEKELLLRYDITHPDKVFQKGFVPWENFEQLDPEKINQATDLEKYVLENVHSVFVGTTRGNWAPRSKANLFCYYIFAPGGIDVNQTIGEHKWKNQKEIAFFGGIRTEFIYAAVEYDENQNQKNFYKNSLYQGPPSPLGKRRARNVRLLDET